YSKGEIIGHTDLDIFPVSEADRYRKSDKQILEGKRKAYIEETGINGVWREEYKCPVLDHKGNIIGTTGFNRDITHRKLKDKALREAERKEKQLLKETIELKDNFITLITHEFKTPIAIINAAIQTMEHVCNKDLSAQALKYINKIKQNSFRQQRLVENLLDITRLKAGMMKLNLDNIEIVEFTKEIVDSVKVVALRKDIKIYFKSTIECEWVKLDFEKYERIVLNLLSNAIKYTPVKKNINVKLSIEGFFIKLEIKDRGMGIPSDKQDIIFDKFEQIDSSFSRQAEGTGIGLYLVRSFTEALGGTVSLISKEGQGSTFTVLLPKIKEMSVQSQMIQKDVINKAVSIELSDII
ncbi:MAG: ATP-binding protein, partial [Bacillota bacterium]